MSLRRDPIDDVMARARAGDERAAAELFAQVYGELRALAEGYFRRQPEGHTLQPTALVHEVFLRMVREGGRGFESRSHFVAVAATAMRQILVDRARRRGAQKRGGDATRVTITTDLAPLVEAGEPEVIDVLALDAALDALSALSPRQARIVELLYFGGLTVEETAEALASSKSLVEKEWRRARAWLRRELAAPNE